MAKKKTKKASAKVKRPAKKAMSRMKPKKAASSKKSPSKVQVSKSSSRPKWLPAGANPISPILVLKNVDAALDFYQKAFGFRVRNVMRGPDNSVMHAEMTLHDSAIMMGPE